MGAPAYDNPEFTRMPLKLKGVLIDLGISVREWANMIVQTRGHVRGKPLSHTAGVHLINYGNWPKLTSREEIITQTAAMLQARGVPQERIDSAFDIDPDDAYRRLLPLGTVNGRAAQHAAANEPIHPIDSPKETDMLLRAESVRPHTRKHFGILTSPFAEDVDRPEDIFMWPDYRYAREALWDAARNGAFRAICGESGSGKTTLVAELKERISAEGHQVVLIEPYVVGMEENDRKGKQLKSGEIAVSVIQSLSPHTSIRQSADARFRQAHELLKESSRAGYRHLLLIEEAHALPLITLKHLKRWRELKDGLRALLGIALIGQPELKVKLDERNPLVREVVQRCELVDLMPLDDNVEKYLALKFERVNKPLGEVFTADAFDAIRARLTFSMRGGSRAAVSMLYPLAVNNLTARAMNVAAELGVPKVNAEVIKGA